MNDTRHPNPDAMSVGAAADELGVSIDTIRRWCDNGKLSSFTTPGGHRRIPTEAITAIRGAA